MSCWERQTSKAYQGYILGTSDDRPGPRGPVPVIAIVGFNKKKRMRETKNLSTNADSSTDTTVGWTKNTQKPNFFEKRKKSSKTEKLKNV